VNADRYAIGAGTGAYRNLMRLYPDSGRAVVMFGNLTSYPVEHLAAAVLRVDPPRPRAAAPGMTSRW
jgi:hypothetical protein